jgi:uncharacterized iron-regulated membrane protein
MRNASLQGRNRRRLLGGVVATLLCAAFLAGGAMVPVTPVAAEPLRVAQANNGISLAQATRMVREQTGGQVLRAETKRDKGRTVHRIRVLTEDGRVRTFTVDAETGRIR